MSNGHFDFIQELRAHIAQLEDVKKTLEHLENEEILRYIDSQDLFIVSNKGGMFLYVNASMAECLGFSKFSILAQSWASLLHPDDMDERQRAFRLINQGGIKETDNVILRYRHRSGKKYIRIQWLYSTAWAGDVILGRGRCLGE